MNALVGSTYMKKEESGLMSEEEEYKHKPPLLVVEERDEKGGSVYYYEKALEEKSPEGKPLRSSLKRRDGPKESNGRSVYYVEDADLNLGEDSRNGSARRKIRISPLPLRDCGVEGKLEQEGWRRRK